MAGKKKAEPIVSLGNVDKLTVQKSQNLYSLWQSDLTLAEFKILDTYLSRIDSHRPDKRTVCFEKGELEKLLGVKKINQSELETRLMHLMGNVVKISDVDEKKGFKLVSLFEEATAEQDDFGQWQINLECTQKAMKYFFNIENLGYLRYKLRCITSLTSRYTYIMFVYLEANRYRKSWKIDLQELKKLLDCKAERYDAYKFFNAEVLKRIQKEMHEKTECRYSYEPIKKGRSVVAIKFTLETKPEIEFDPNQMTIEQWQEESAETNGNKELWISALEINGKIEFNPDQIKLIRQYLICVPSEKMPKIDEFYNNIEFERYHYIAQKMAIMNARTGIKNRFNYLVKLIKKDAAIED